MSNVVKFIAHWEPREFLDIILNMDADPMKQVLKLFGGRHKVINLLSIYFEANPEYTTNDQYGDLFKYILFDCSEAKTYREDWDNLWDTIKDLPLKFLVDALECYPPGKRNQNGADVALSYILWNKYRTSELTPEIYEQLKDLFEDTPKDFETFKEKQHYIDELKLFNDPDFLYNNYTNISFETKEILNLLKEVVISRKLDTPEKISTFLNIVDWFAPKNSFDRKYQDAFILEIFESDDESGEDMWSESSIDLWKEKFYNVDFDFTNSDTINSCIKDSVQQESDHISKMLEINPNYRHD